MEDYKKIYQKWLQSKKLELFLSSLKEKREEKIKQTLDLTFINKFKPDRNMTDEQINSILDSILESNALTPEEKEEIEYLTACLNAGKDRKTLYFEFIRTLANWFFYLKRSIDKENYKLAAKLRDVIQIDTNEFIQYLSKYTEEYDAYEEEYINEILQELRKQFKI